MRVFRTGRHMPAGIADKTGKRQLVKPHERRAEDTAGRLAPRAGPIAPAPWRSDSMGLPMRVVHRSLRIACFSAIDVSFVGRTQSPPRVPCAVMGGSDETAACQPEAPSGRGGQALRHTLRGVFRHAIGTLRPASHRQRCSGTGSWSVSFGAIRPPLALAFKRV
jgi:hypothetical protein